MKCITWIIIHHLLANFSQHMPVKNYKNRQTYIKVMSEDKVALFETQCSSSYNTQITAFIFCLISLLFLNYTKLG